MNCRTCRFLDVKPSKTGRIVPRSGNAYRCLAPIGVPPPLPASVKPRSLNWPPAKSWVEPDDGDDCVSHEVRQR